MSLKNIILKYKKKNIYSGLATVYKIILEINITPYKFADIIVHHFFFRTKQRGCHNFVRQQRQLRKMVDSEIGVQTRNLNFFFIIYNFNLRIQTSFVEESCEIKIENIQKDTHTQYKATARNFENIETL